MQYIAHCETPLGGVTLASDGESLTGLWFDGQKYFAASLDPSYQEGDLPVFAQARACAEAGVFLISPFVGRIYDWYQARKPMDPYVVEEDPGVKSVRNIYDYYKQHHYETIVMGASFRRTEQILALTGCDRLTIAPNLLKELQEKVSPVVRKLIPPSQTFPRPAPMSEAEFRWEHNQDAMAVEKLSEGIRLFAVDQRKLEDLLAAKL